MFSSRILSFARPALSICEKNFLCERTVFKCKRLSTSQKMSKTALVILAQGAEEMETVITVDMLRRGGVTVTMAGLDGSAPVLCSRQVTLVPDKALSDALAENPQYDAKMSKTALVILAQGAEEMETVITVDMLRRGGVTVTMAGLDGSAPVLCSRQVTLVPDKALSDALAENPQYDAVILPGGLEGSDRLSKSSVVGTLLKEHEKAGRIIAAICAAPTAFVAHGVAQGKKVTSYPTTKDKITGDYTYVEGERVVVDGNVVTSRGPGTAYWFGLKLIELLTGKEKADQVEKGMIITGY